MNAEQKPKPRRNPIAQYFADIWSGIATTYTGMRLTLRYFFSKPVTLKYPEQRPVVPETHRGLHAYYEEKCGLCRRCAMVCPVDCITIETAGRGKDQIATKFAIDYSRCLFCNLCAEACQSAAIVLTESYDLSGGSREGCKREFARPKSEQEIAELNERIAKKAAEKARAAQENPVKKAKPEEGGAGE